MTAAARARAAKPKAARQSARSRPTMNLRKLKFTHCTGNAAAFMAKPLKERKRIIHEFREALAPLFADITPEKLRERRRQAFDNGCPVEHDAQ